MTRVLIAADGHYYRDKQGDVYVESVFNYAFFSRYLSVFDEVLALGRMQNVDVAPNGKRRADGPGVRFLDLRPGKGFKSFVTNYYSNAAVIRDAALQTDCAVLRIPGVVANQSYSIFKATGKPLAIEVVVDPWEYFNKGVNGGAVRPVVQRVWTRQLKRACLEANGVSYVTEHYLQEKYPCQAILGKEGYFTGSYSSVELPDESFGEPRTFSKPESLKIAHVANTFQGNSKGHYTLIDAAKKVLNCGRSIELVFVGDGPDRRAYAAYANALGIGSNVAFTGRLADGMEVKQLLRNVDMFVFPTKAEGLPRVLLEAMSEGLPCLSSPVCGIPELLEPEFMFSPDDSDGFARGIVNFFDNSDLMTKQSVKNLQVARNYSSSKLKVRRDSFYGQLRELV